MFSSKRNIALACALSAVAGYVDGIGFVHLGGLFVSFMSGNSTRLGVSLASWQWHPALEAIGLIALFVIGAGIGSLIVTGRGKRRQMRVLIVEGALLAIAGIAATLHIEQLAVCAIVLAMGMENAVFQIEGGAGMGLTYVTGALVKVGQLAAVALRGGARWAWLPNLLLWAALVIGAVLGALAYRPIGLSAIWIAAGVVLLLAAIVAMRGESNSH